MQDFINQKDCGSLIPDFLIHEYVRLRHHSSKMLFLSLRTNEPVTADTAVKHLFSKLKKKSGKKAARASAPAHIRDKLPHRRRQPGILTRSHGTQ